MGGSRKATKSKKVGGSRKATSKGVQKRKTKPARVIEYISVPKHWFTDVVNTKMKQCVRPPTSKTRRKELPVDFSIPEVIFFEMMKPLETGCVRDFEWLDGEKTRLKPTKEHKTFLEYAYVFDKPSLIDKLWRLEEKETANAQRGVASKSGAEARLMKFRRGHGCARLHLSAAAAERGELTDLLSQVTGSVKARLKVPREEKQMPTCRLLVRVSTMTKTGHIIWGDNFGDKTRAALRKQMRYHLAEMVKSPEYPTLSAMEPSLTNASEHVHAYTGGALLLH